MITVYRGAFEKKFSSGLTVGNIRSEINAGDDVTFVNGNKVNDDFVVEEGQLEFLPLNPMTKGVCN